MSVTQEEAVATPAPIGHNQAPVVPEFEEFDQLLGALSKRYDGIEYDLTDPAQDRQARTDQRQLGTAIADLDRTHQRVKAPLLEKTRAIDGERKRIKDALLVLQGGIKEQLAEVARQTAERAAALVAKVQAIRDLAVFDEYLPAEQLRSALEKARAINLEDGYDERKAEAALAQVETVAQLEHDLATAERLEAETAELARLRAEQEARDRAEREERIRVEAADTARREAEEKARLEREEADAKAEKAHQAAAEKLAAEQRAREEIEQRAAEEKAAAERAAVEAEERRKREAAEAETREQEAAKRAASEERDRIERERQAAESKATKARAAEEKKRENQKHRARVHAEARGALVAAYDQGNVEPLSEDVATAIITLIRDGAVTHVRIDY